MLLYRSWRTGWTERMPKSPRNGSLSILSLWSTK